MMSRTTFAQERTERSGPLCPVLIVRVLDICPDCTGFRLELVGPHHLVILMVGDVAVEDVVAGLAIGGRRAGIKGEAACCPYRNVLGHKAHDDACHLAGLHDGRIFPACLVSQWRSNYP